jgi:predicted Rossmann fold nucleotide-binding protein DprA/Smf involved in DNA uptake
VAERNGAMASVIDEALTLCKARLDELEETIQPLTAERDQLREAIEKLALLTAGRSRTDGAGASSPRRSVTRKSGRRAPRGQNRRRILDAIQEQPKTATEVARETQITVGTVSSTLTKLLHDGLATKASRGYKAT